MTAEVPQITRFGDAAVMKAVNGYLSELARNAHCEEPPDDHSFEAAVSFVGEDMFSVRITEGWMCGAPYPTTGADGSVSFDLRTGKLVTLEDLFAAGALARADELLFAYQRAQARLVKPGSGDESECLDRFRPETELPHGDTRFHFSPGGLVVTEELPHAMAACAYEVTVPYAALAPVAAPGSALARLAAADTRRPIRYRIQTRDGKDVEYTPPAR